MIHVAIDEAKGTFQAVMTAEEGFADITESVIALPMVVKVEGREMSGYFIAVEESNGS